MNDKSDKTSKENFEARQKPRADENLFGFFRVLLEVDMGLNPENYKKPDNQDNNQSYD